MFSTEQIKHRAMMMGILTGEMPDVQFIWSVQTAEGSNPCFGQGQDCKQVDCRWRRKCRALDFYQDATLPTSRPKLEPQLSTKKQTDQNLHISSVARASSPAGLNRLDPALCDS